MRSAAANSTRLFYQPVTAVLGAVSLALTGYVLWLTLNDISLLKPTAGHFVGVDNYLRLATDSRGLAALWRTVKFTIATAGVEVFLASPSQCFSIANFPAAASSAACC